MVERSLGVGEATGSIPVSPTVGVTEHGEEMVASIAVGSDHDRTYRGIAQLAERLVRDQEVLSSSLSTPTIFPQSA